MKRTVLIPESVGVASEGAGMASFHEAGPGASPRATLQAIRVGPIAQSIAKPPIVNGHYLHSYPGGTKLAFGAFLGSALLGVLTLGVGPKLGYQLVAGAKPEDCVTLTRLWLSDRLPRNSESRVLGIVLRALKRHTSLKFVLAYADPSVGHVGTIYQAGGWSVLFGNFGSHAYVRPGRRRSSPQSKPRLHVRDPFSATLRDQRSLAETPAAAGESTATSIS